MSKTIEEYMSEANSLKNGVLSSDYLLRYPETLAIIERFYSELNKKNFGDNSIYQIEAEIVESLVRGAMVNINSYKTSEKRLQIVAVCGLRDMIENILKFGGFKIVGRQLPLEDQFAEIALMQGRLHRIPRGLKDAALKGFPDMLVDLIDEMLGPFFCYGAGFVYKNELVGNLAIIGRQLEVDMVRAEIINSLLPIFAIVEMIYRCFSK
ncbi:MAG: hypothetical protein ACP5QK_00025 [Myxococcota bacterium]